MQQESPAIKPGFRCCHWSCAPRTDCSYITCPRTGPLFAFADGFYFGNLIIRHTNWFDELIVLNILLAGCCTFGQYLLYLLYFKIILSASDQATDILRHHVF